MPRLRFHEIMRPDLTGFSWRFRKYVRNSRFPQRILIGWKRRGRYNINEEDTNVMLRAKMWFRCAAMRDPVIPVLVRPAVIGWKGKRREIDLTIEREFTGAELLLRMKGWITVNPKEAVEIFEKHGRLKCFDTGELVVELEDQAALAALQAEVAATLGDQCDVEPIPKKV